MHKQTLFKEKLPDSKISDNKELPTPLVYLKPNDSSSYLDKKACELVILTQKTSIDLSHIGWFTMTGQKFGTVKISAPPEPLPDRVPSRFHVK